MGKIIGAKTQKITCGLYESENLPISLNDATSLDESGLTVTKIEIPDIVNIVDIFRAKIVDISDFSTTIEVTGDPGKITTILNILKPYKIIEIVRTGKISIERELGINSEILHRI